MNGSSSSSPTERKPWAQALVFEGGGTKGIHYAGAISALEAEWKAEGCTVGRAGIKHYAGTSAGAQTAALLAFGYSGEELEEMMLETPWSTILDGAGPPCNRGCCCGYGCCKGCCRLFRYHGFYLGDVMETYLDAKFALKIGKPRCTFQELYDHEGKQTWLRVGVCNMTTKQFDYLDYQSCPDLPVCEAVRASSAIPLVFLPQIIEGNVYIDGMFQGNLPVAAFPDDLTLAFHLSNSVVDSESASPGPNRQSVWAFIAEILDMMMNSAQRKNGINFMSFRPADLGLAAGAARENLDILTIDCGNTGPLDVGVTQAQIRAMIETGRKCAQEYLESGARQRFRVMEADRRDYGQKRSRSTEEQNAAPGDNLEEAFRVVRRALGKQPSDGSMLQELNRIEQELLRGSL